MNGSLHLPADTQKLLARQRIHLRNDTAMINERFAGGDFRARID